MSAASTGFSSSLVSSQHPFIGRQLQPQDYNRLFHLLFQSGVVGMLPSCFSKKGYRVKDSCLPHQISSPVFSLVWK